MEQSLISVGIDIGTSTTQLVFCKLVIENMATAWTVPAVRIVDQQILYKSAIHFTPMLSENTLDALRIRNLVEEEYRIYGIKPKEVGSGAVIITGEAARKSNAEEILTMLSGLAGDFVVSTAGPDLEGILAGKGSGACAYSKERSLTIMNFDIGGGTTNVAVYRHGDVIDSACYDIGGRLIQFDSAKRISYLSQKMKALITALGLSCRVTDTYNSKVIAQITEAMSLAILKIAQGNHEDPLVKLLITNHGLKGNYVLDAICFSGGVADCFEATGDDLFRYNDIGIFLGRQLNEAIKTSGLKVFTARETIRATVIGAGVHTTTISGSTINYNKELLPLKNIPIIRLANHEEGLLGKLRQEAIEKRLNWTIHAGEIPLVALSLKGSRRYGFDALQLLAQDIVLGMKRVIQSDQPLVVVIDQDIGKSLGLCIRGHLSQEKPVICIDSVVVDNGDYIDIGTPVAEGQVLPVIIKTLLFGY